MTDDVIKQQEEVIITPSSPYLSSNCTTIKTGSAVDLREVDQNEKSIRRL